MDGPYIRRSGRYKHKVCKKCLVKITFRGRNAIYCERCSKIVRKEKALASQVEYNKRRRLKSLLARQKKIKELIKNER